MNIVADMSLYPLKNEPVPDIIEFIRDLRAQPDLEVVSNQLSTQVGGSFEAVTTAVNRCMRKAMERPETVVLIVRYLNIERDLDRAPTLTPDA